ncbi:hypothetical protein C8F01DRAFT_1116225 [Mycena amicta]|nr:hypothetical protein C8F01DRAFT_1116225 [Mycena amicta]
MASMSPTAVNSPLETPSPTDELEYYDEEPDEEWKTTRKEMIAETFQPTITEAKDRLERVMQSIRGLETDKEEQDRMQAHYVAVFQDCMTALKALAKEEFECALKREMLHRRIRRNLPVPMMPMDMDDLLDEEGELINHLDIEQEQAATLRAATQTPALEKVEEAFQSLIDFSSAPEPEQEPEPEPEPEQDAPGPQALTIKITRLPAAEGVVWSSASSAAKQYQERIKQQRAASKPEASQPAEPPKRWVSASDAAQRYRRITG